MALNLLYNNGFEYLECVLTYCLQAAAKISKGICPLYLVSTLLENFWRISLYVTDVAIAKLYVCDVKLSEIEGN